MDILIKSGIIVTSEKSFNADIAIDQGKIIRIGEGIQPEMNTRIIDASDLFVIPGGIDPHVHLYLPTPAGYTSDDFYSGSKAAIYGGTTCIIDFVTPARNQNLIEALNIRKKEAHDSLIDYSFHLSPVDWHSNIENEINKVVEEGITSFKVYMAYKNSVGIEDDVLMKVMQAVSKAGGIVTVHAENGDKVDELRNSYYAQGKISPEYHALSRPNYTEADSVAKIIHLSEQTACKVYIVHVSAKESLELIQSAQNKGLPIYAETCPQYLLLEDSKLKGKFEETAKYVFSPPLRKKEDNDALLKALKNKTILTIGTDHCPFFFKQKEFGRNDFRLIPNGAGGIEHRLALLYTFGVMPGLLTMNEFVALTSTNAAKIFGLYPKKGEIAVGSDADIVLWDTKPSYSISASKHYHNSDIDIYEGFTVFGQPKHIISKGNIVFDENVLYLDKCKSEFLKRVTER
jgi:dihydropyrimidinase